MSLPKIIHDQFQAMESWVFRSMIDEEEEIKERQDNNEDKIDLELVKFEQCVLTITNERISLSCKCAYTHYQEKFGQLIHQMNGSVYNIKHLVMNTSVKLKHL